MPDSSSDSKRAWLLQATGKYVDYVPEFLGRLRNTGYWNLFYAATKPPIKYIQPKCLEFGLPEDFGWSNNIIRLLNEVKEDVFFMGCEDHLLVDFNREIVENAFWLVSKGDFGCIRLTRKPQIKTGTGHVFFPVDKSYKYYVSLQPSVWSKKYLESIIVPDENAWEFEINASARAKKLDLPAGVVYKTAFNYINLSEGTNEDYVSKHG